MRQIDKIIIHFSDTPARMDIGVDEIMAWHTDPKPNGNGWDRGGYHFVVRRNGRVEEMEPVSRQAWHARGHNSHSIGICLVGGRGKDNRAEANFTHQQWAALFDLVERLTRRYPDAEVIGHNEVSNKECPGFDVAAWWN
jgi:N-acetylmuramoyl-L-alanine amidase